ncbi:hypothetical protein WUBG_14860, partial [Wuchereria bancrofti]
MEIYINEMWLDPALNFESHNPCKDNLSLNHQVLDRLWTPNSCFINSKIAEIHESPFRNFYFTSFTFNFDFYKIKYVKIYLSKITDKFLFMKLAKNIFLMLYPNGTVWVNYRVRVKGPCVMDLSNFPMDVQTCYLIYESFNYNNQEVRMRWNTINPNPVYVVSEILLPDFILINITSTLRIE